MIRHIACWSCAILCAIELSAHTRAATVDFGTAFANLPYTENGLTFTDVTGTSPASIGGFGADKALVGGTNFTPIHVRATGVTPFDLLSFDIETISRTWRIESSSGAIFNPTTAGTINFTLMAGWTNLTYFDIVHSPAEPNGSIRVDDVAFNFVPEPSALVLIIGSMFGLAWTSRPRYSAAR
jgi:hypothetical protein